jgi:hypothetical protein
MHSKTYFNLISNNCNEDVTKILKKSDFYFRKFSVNEKKCNPTVELKPYPTSEGNKFESLKNSKFGKHCSRAQMS